MIETSVRHEICSRCGNIFVYEGYSSHRTCKSCLKALKEKKKALNPKDKYQSRFENAVNEIYSQVKDKEAYQKAINGASRAMYSYGSIPEAMVAIELIKIGYKIIPQQKILSYHADFVIPDQKLVIEVDGGIYHTKQTGRDAEIQMALGFDWKIIHIPAELIRKDIQKLQKCIELYK